MAELSRRSFGGPSGPGAGAQGTRGRPARVAGPAVVWSLILFVVGVIYGLKLLVSDAITDGAEGFDTRPANLVHLAMAGVAAVAAAVIRHRDRDRFRALVSLPWSPSLWRGYLAAWTAPLRLLPLPRLRRLTGPLIVRLVWGVVAPAAALLWTFVPIRAGMQVFAGFDHDMVVDAWGGPTMIGADLAHWFDAVLLAYLAAVLLVRYERRLADPDRGGPIVGHRR